ncbi:MAG TPA: hypothetical protein VHC63_15320 [Acidimicrobiales bacterium]|nr:hypothetical protein [Acidimicrobiales bacterium]
MKRVVAAWRITLATVAVGALAAFVIDYHADHEHDIKCRRYANALTLTLDATTPDEAALRKLTDADRKAVLRDRKLHADALAQLEPSDDEGIAAENKNWDTFRRTDRAQLLAARGC